LHGAGFTGSGERYLNSLVGVEAGRDGVVRVLVSSAEFGQGTNTVLCQIAAEALGLPYENIAIAQPDTAVVPNSGPTVASRTAMIVENWCSQPPWASRNALEIGAACRELHFGPISRSMPEIHCCARSAEILCTI